MKNPWLALAAILALLATATGAKKNRYLMRILNSTYYPGSYSVLGLPGRLEEPVFNRTDVLTMPSLEPSKVVCRAEEKQKGEDLKGPPPLPPQLELKSGPRTKRGAIGVRRGRLRAGTRPICRGCYSGLMIVGLPVQESKNASWNESHSESEGRSSEGD
ncbi:uncharacterized protein PHA67_017431 [Liasis olivaceus]